MSQDYNLLLSPHPDDLVFSAFSAIANERETKKVAIVFFNVSKFTRWPIHSMRLVSIYRTLEDRAILGTLKLKVKYLFKRDSSVTGNETENRIDFDWKFNLQNPSKILCPLGVGRNPNHLSVRAWAIAKWLEWKRKPNLLFYEDLPYAAKIEDPVGTEKEITESLSPTCGKIEELIKPLTLIQMSKKLKFSAAYFSQTNYTELLERYGRIRGRRSPTGYAEMFYRVA